VALDRPDGVDDRLQQHRVLGVGTNFDDLMADSL
jgi:hypothetical protein